MKKEIKVIAAILLLGMASLMVSCTEEVDVSLHNNVLEVGEKTTVTCTFNKGKEVQWDKSNDNVSFVPHRGSKVDEIDIMGVKEGVCRVSATGKEGTIDNCDVTVKTYARLDDDYLHDASLYVGDRANLSIRSGYDLEKEYDPFYIQVPTSVTNTNNLVDYASYSIVLEAKHVGETYVRFYDMETGNSVVDTGLVVKVLPRYPNYMGVTDFDDTQDSIKIKFGTVFSEEITDEGDLEWTFYNYSNTLLLNVTFDQNHNNNLVKSFGMAYAGTDIITEVIASIEERFEFLGSYQGMNIYADADSSIMIGTQMADNYLIVVVVPNASKSTMDQLNNEIIKKVKRFR